MGLDFDLGSSEAHALARVHDHEHLLDRLQRDQETCFLQEIGFAILEWRLMTSKRNKLSLNPKPKRSKLSLNPKP
jgi:hypothetical protein